MFPRVGRKKGVIAGAALLFIGLMVPVIKFFNGTEGTDSDPRHDTGKTQLHHETRKSDSSANVHVCYQEHSAENKQPAKKGEHVINNNVFKVYSKILEGFVEEVLHDNFVQIKSKLSPNSKVIKALEQPINDKLKNWIRDEMVVHYLQAFTDKNANTYGQCIKKLVEDAIDYMTTVSEALQSNHWEKVKNDENLRETVNILIEKQLFVDKDARDTWLNKKPKAKQARHSRFEEALHEVIRMFQNLLYNDTSDNMVIAWVKELNVAHQQKNLKN